MSDPKYECPHCSQHLEVPDDLLGQTLECPSCKGQFSIPKPTPVAAQVAAPAATPPAPPSQLDGSCPLCGQTKHMSKAKELYGHMVCKKCYYGFANRRQFAFFLDAIGWRVLMFPVGFAIGMSMAMSGASQTEIESTANAIGYLLLPIFFCKDCFAGHSLGKLICGVRVIDEDNGSAGGIGASFKRNLPLIIPFMPLVVGVQLCKGHRTGDGWSKSKVIWKKYADHPIFAAKQAS